MGKTIFSTLLGVFVGAFLGDPLLYGVAGLLVGRQIDLDKALTALEREVVRLRRAFAADRERRRTAERGAGQGIEGVQGAEVLADPEARLEPAVRSAVEAPSRRAEAAQTSSLAHVRQPAASSESMPDAAAEGPAPATLLALITRFRDWLQSGKLFVRVGILLLFFGVGFLIKYAVEQEFLVFTMGMRLAAEAGA